ncbi:MAG: PASTA domain-containing protein [Firmicutes bacterium]|nr:PASTA domain-containing protein [Bacillota bacterium]
MSSFLDKFTESNYQSTRIQEPPEIKTTNDRKRLTRYIALFFTVIAVTSGFALWRSLKNQVKVIDFSGWTLEDVKVWAAANDVSLHIDFAYDNVHDKDSIIEQSPSSNAKLRKDEYLELLVSSGPDPDEVVNFILEEHATIAEVQKLIDEKKLMNVTLEFTHHASVPINSVINVEYDKCQPQGFRRKDKATVYVSLGPYPRDLRMPSFVGLTKEEAAGWRDSMEFVVDFQYEYVYSEVPPGIIIQQDILPDEKISRDTVVTFKVSKGLQVLMPDYKKTNRSTFDEIDPGSLLVIAVDQYSDSVPYGHYIGQSVPAGTDLTASTNQRVYVYYSLGKPFIEDLIGYTENMIAPYFFNEFTAKGANITYTVRYDEKAQAPYGTIAKISKRMEFLSLNDHVDIIVSKNRNYGE